MPLTNDDKNFIIGAIQKVVEENNKIIFARIEERLKDLPTRKEFFDRTDQTLGRIKKMEDDSQLVQPRLSNHEDRISALEANS